MSKIKKFRKNDWSDDNDYEYYEERRNHKRNKKFDRALRTKDLDYLSDDEDY